MKTNNNKDRSAKEAGFSLIELLAVVVILGTIATVVVPRVSSTSLSAKEKADEMNRSQINATVERYYILEGVWPADDLSDIEANLDYFANGVPSNPVDGTAYQLDPITHRVIVSGGGGGGGGGFSK